MTPETALDFPGLPLGLSAISVSTASTAFLSWER